MLVGQQVFWRQTVGLELPVEYHQKENVKTGPSQCSAQVVDTDVRFFLTNHSNRRYDACHMSDVLELSMVETALIAKNEFRDPIHGFIEVYDHERNIIDTVEFQRLRRIHQLGLTHYVYHGAEHSRFGHALGVMHLAGMATTKLIDRHQGLISETLDWDRLDTNSQKLRLILLARLAGLLHDVGHAPFSHTGEAKLFPENANHENHGATIIRESQIADIIHSDSVLRDLDITANEVANLVISESTIAAGFVQELISSPWDVDKMDYLLRDSHYCGVQYGTYDLGRILNTLTLDPEPDSGSLKLAIDEGGLHALEAFVLARYYMFTQIYFHDVRRAFDLVLTDFIAELLATKTQNGRYPNIDNIGDYLAWDDNFVLAEANRLADPCQKNLAWRIINRQHPKAVYETNDSPDAGVIRRAERDLAKAVAEHFQGLRCWTDKAIDHPDRFRVAQMMVNFGSDLPDWREFRNQSQPLQGLQEINKFRLYADVRGEASLGNEVRDFCRTFMA